MYWSFSEKSSFWPTTANSDNREKMAGAYNFCFTFYFHRLCVYKLMRELEMIFLFAEVHSWAGCKYNHRARISKCAFLTLKALNYFLSFSYNFYEDRNKFFHCYIRWQFFIVRRRKQIRSLTFFLLFLTKSIAWQIPSKDVVKYAYIRETNRSRSGQEATNKLNHSLLKAKQQKLRIGNLTQIHKVALVMVGYQPHSLETLRVGTIEMVERIM